jgi:hypothetical protein
MPHHFSFRIFGRQKNGPFKNGFFTGNSMKIKAFAVFRGGGPGAARGLP